MGIVRGCEPFPECTERALCRGSCARYMLAQAEELRQLRERIASLGNKKSRPQAAEREEPYGKVAKT